MMLDSRDESELLAQIHEELSQEFRARYRVLHERLEAEEFTDKERREFLRMNKQAERLNTERMTALFALAQRRGVTLNEIMSQLGVGPVEAV